MKENKTTLNPNDELIKKGFLLAGSLREAS